MLHSGHVEGLVYIYIYIYIYTSVNSISSLDKYIYEGGLKSSYNFISVIDNFLTYGIQALQQRLKKCVDHKVDYSEK